MNDNDDLSAARGIIAALILTLAFVAVLWGIWMELPG